MSADIVFMIWRRLRRILFTCVVVFVVAGVCAWLFPNTVLTVDSGNVKADVIVVLGGGGGERSKRTAELFAENVAPRVLLTGFGDCEMNRELLVQGGVPDTVIQSECNSHTTRENA